MGFLERIDPEVRDGLQFYEVIGMTRGKDLTLEEIATIREMSIKASEAMGSFPPNERVARKDYWIPVLDGETHIRVYRPIAAKGPLPAMIWFHGGGMMFASMEVDVPLCERFADEVGCIAISVEYRLAPENPYPAAINDCYATLVWAKENAEEIGVDAACIGIGGESAGGLLAAATALLARDRRGPAVVFQLLAYPVIDNRSDSPSMREFESIPTWNRMHNHWAWTHYLAGQSVEDIDCYAVPARATDLSGLPPALIQVGELDTLRDEGIDYAVRLMQAGVSTELHVYPAVYHGWDASAPMAQVSSATFQERKVAIRRALFLHK